MNISPSRRRAQLLQDFGHALLQIPGWLPLPHDKGAGRHIGRDLFGVNVASSDDPRCDDYVVNHLRQAGIQHVRLSLDDTALDSYPQRFLDRLLDEGFDVMVSLLPAFSDAQRLNLDASATQSWRRFLNTFLAAYGQRVSLVEIGNTPNRPKWSGYTPTGYLTAWEIAVEEAQPYATPLAGPNISDFEPVFNTSYLRRMQLKGASPTVHTDNLFVERAVQPEQYDPSAFGKLFAKPLKLNLAKKINIFSAISSRYGVERTFCTYTCWTSKRLSRWSVFPEAKGADYLVRYLVICCTNPGLDRIYWGPLIDSRDGLIDCGTKDYPYIDNVTHYKSVRGEVTHFQPKPSFHAYAFITNLLKGTICLQGVGSTSGVNHYIFADDKQVHHILWSPDGLAHNLFDLYPAAALGGQRAQIRDVFGQALTHPLEKIHISESPLILTWTKPAGAPSPGPQQIRDCQPIGPRGTQHTPQDQFWTGGIDDPQWRGVAKISISGEESWRQALLPQHINTRPVIKTLRDNRNKLWVVEHPFADTRLVVKQNRAKGIKRLSYLFQDSKGKRHWNTATIMLRRGVNTPEPIAYTERKRFSGLYDNYYVAQHLEDAFSTRDLFTAFALGESTYRGISKADWLTQVAHFVAHMHQRRITHRDLSSGNILITLDQDQPKIYVIDIGRARVDAHFKPLLDIKRICYKLSWADREFFVDQYLQIFSKKALGNWRLALHSYDWKLIIKRKIKSLLPKRGK